MKVLVGLPLVAAVIFFLPCMGVLFGAFSGWVVGLFFEETVMGFLGRVGFNTAGFEMWQVGAVMGFLGAFLKTSVTSNNKN